MIATDLMLNVFLKYGTVVRPSTPSSIVFRKAQGRLSLATPGFEEACEVATIFMSLATGKVTSAALLVRGPATASAFSSPANFRRLFVACAGFVASSRMAR